MAVLVSDFLGRRVDLLGRTQQFKNAANLANTANIFQIGGIQFPSTAGLAHPTSQGRCMVLFVTIDNYASPLDPSAGLSFGSSPAYSDWLTISVSNYSAYFPGTITVTQVAFIQTVYAPGNFFGVKNVSIGGVQNDSLTITAYGWAY